MRQVIYAWNYTQWGGSQIYTLSLLKTAVKYFEVVVLMPVGSDEQLLGFLDELNVRCEFFSPPADLAPATSIRRRMERRLAKIRSENSMILAIKRVRGKESLFHVDLAPQQSFFSLLRLTFDNIVFFTAHNSSNRYSFLREFVWTLKLRYMSRVQNFNMFCANRDARNYLCRYLPAEACSRITVTPAAIDPSEINDVYAERSLKLRIREENDLPTDRTIILTVGQFVDRKGPWILLEAAKLVLGEDTNVQFVWLTSELPTGRALERIDSFGLKESFRLIRSSTVGGTRRSILRFFLGADMFVLPSLIEGLPIAILESMALGLPTISTRISAIPEAIIENETGVLVEPGDAHGLAGAILALNKDSHHRGEIAQNGRDFVLRHFDERNTARTAISAYNEAFEKLYR